MYWVGARGSAKSDPFVRLCDMLDQIDTIEHSRKNYRKARWKRSHNRYFKRAAKDIIERAKEKSNETQTIQELLCLSQL